jgi:ADP-ribose pyrophosphatase YjhB (NUDIX family)
MQYILRLALKKGSGYLLYDNPDTGKWELPACWSQSDQHDKRMLSFFNRVLDMGVAPLGLRKVHTDASYLPRKGENVKVITEIYDVDDYAGDPPVNARWQFISPSSALKLGNLEMSCRRWFTVIKAEKTAMAAFSRKEASGPRNTHRSVSAVIRDEKGWILLMEHPYQKVWSIPKGHIDEGENAREAVVRELEEELGITSPVIEFKGWYVEKYRTGGDTTPVKHYIYEVKSYEGKPVNKEKARFGEIGMFYASPDEIEKMNDVSLMTVNAMKLLKTSKKAGVLPYFLGAMAMSQALPLLNPSYRRKQIAYLKRDLGGMGVLPAKQTGDLFRDLMTSGGELYDTGEKDVLPAITGAYDSVVGEAGKVPGMIRDWFN